MTIIEAMEDENLFSRWFQGESWSAWKVVLKATFGIPLTGREPKLFCIHTKRQSVPNTAEELWLIVGRRGGKSLISALIAVFLSCFKEYAQCLAPGEVATVMVIAADRRQARTVLRYINGFLDNAPMLSRMVVNRTRESIELSNRVVIEIHTCSFRAVRGYTVAAVIADEIAYWRSDDFSANPDVEVLAGLRPGMVCISSSHARYGALWQAYRRYLGENHPNILVWQAPSRAMNPMIEQKLIDAAFERDETAAQAEYGAQFRSDLETFIAREVVESCVVMNRHELPPVEGVRYEAFVDPSGGSQDSMTMAVGHREGNLLVVDAIRERKPPFNPGQVAREFSELVHRYRISRVSGDRYGGQWPTERFREHGITYEPSGKVKSDLYGEFLPVLNTGEVQLLDNQRLINQICNLERKTARSGKDSIDHGPNRHDDLANVVAGLNHALSRRCELYFV